MTDKEKDLNKFEEFLGYPCNLSDPQTHNEKVMWKKYNDRDPLLTITSDKIKVKGYVEDILGKNTGMFSQRLYEGYDLIEAKKYMTVPCVIKANNASGRNIFLSAISKELVNIAINNIQDNKWFSRKYGAEKSEWAYQDIKPGIVIEEKVFDDIHSCHRFLCFKGKVEYIQVHHYDSFNFGTVPNISHVSTFDKDWNLVPVNYKHYPYRNHAKPIQYEKLVEYSEKLSSPFNFCRIDYLLDFEKTYFGEITHYPVSGKCKFTPESFDYKLGGLW